MWIFLRSVIRGGLAGRGGCGPHGHDIKEHKSEGMRGTKHGGTVAVVTHLSDVLSCSWEEVALVLFGTEPSARSDSKHTGSHRSKMTTDDSGCGSFCSRCCLSLMCNLSWQIIRKAQRCLSSKFPSWLNLSHNPHQCGVYEITTSASNYKDVNRKRTHVTVRIASTDSLSFNSFMLWALKK